MPFHVPGIETPQPVDPLVTYAVHEDGTPDRALLDKVGASPPKLMDDNNEQFWKTYESIVKTVDGMVIDSSRLHPLNA